MRTSNSGAGHGTNGSPQTSLEQQLTETKANENEEAVTKELDKPYDLQTLPNSSPIWIPKNVKPSEELKNGYAQVQYKWTRGKYNYVSRWHQRTPNAPITQGNSWVVERKIPGKGYGPDARKATHEVLVKTKSGDKRWVPFEKWREAISARKKGTATTKQKEMLDNGHWPAP